MDFGGSESKVDILTDISVLYYNLPRWWKSILPYSSPWPFYHTIFRCSYLSCHSLRTGWLQTML